MGLLEYAKEILTLFNGATPTSPSQTEESWKLGVDFIGTRIKKCLRELRGEIDTLLELSPDKLITKLVPSFQDRKSSFLSGGDSNMAKPPQSSEVLGKLKKMIDEHLEQVVLPILKDKGGYEPEVVAPVHLKMVKQLRELAGESLDPKWRHLREQKELLQLMDESIERTKKFCETALNGIGIDTGEKWKIVNRTLESAYSGISSTFDSKSTFDEYAFPSLKRSEETISEVDDEFEKVELTDPLPCYLETTSAKKGIKEHILGLLGMNK